MASSGWISGYELPLASDDEEKQNAHARRLLLRAISDSVLETGILSSVSSANLELVRSIHAAWERGDYSSAEWAHREIEYVFADGPTPGSWTGPAGMAEGWRGFLSAWKEFRVEADEYRELDSERVLVLVHRSGRGKTSGLEVGQIGTRGASPFHIRDRKVTRLVIYQDGERALADLGLVPKTGSPRS
jgi:ketosteroid isomerase-like protein